MPNTSAFKSLTLLTTILLPVFFSILLGALYTSNMPTDPALIPVKAPYPGDELIPDAVMVYDQTRIINGTRAQLWPWIVQLGKGRAGWYCPAKLEKWMPAGWPASRVVEERWQGLEAGDRVDDYGFSADDYFDVAAVEPEKALVYRSDRYGARFSWALLLHELPIEEAGRHGQRTMVHLRFRGAIAATGLKRKVLVWGGGLMDHLTTAPLLAGLAERIGKPHVR